MDSPFSHGGLTPNLIPNPPGAIPEAPEAGSALPKSPFKEALDIDAICANLVLDRPLKLFVPKREQYPEWDFRIINSVPQEMAVAHNQGFRPVDTPELVELFTDLVAGTDKHGKAYRPVLMARPKKVTAMALKRNRTALHGLYSGMDPRQNDKVESKYTSNVRDHKDGSAGVFTGAGWRIRV